VTRYLEDCTVGQRFVSHGRTVTEADIVNFAGLSGDFNPLHMDEQWVRENTPFRGRIAHGMLIASISSGIRTPGLDELEVVAYLEVARAMKAPVYPGDTIRVETVVEEVRQSASRPGTGVLKLAVSVLNDRDELVQSGSEALLVAMTPAEVEFNGGGPR
jgi:3-hydroxybutyryl-CoA dehydratase